MNERVDMGRKKQFTNETRLQVPLKNGVLKKLEKAAEKDSLGTGRKAAKIITSHFNSKSK